MVFCTARPDGPPILPDIPHTTLLSADFSSSVHARPRPTSLLPAGPLPRRSGAVRAHNHHRKSWNPPSNPPILHLDIPSRNNKLREVVELDATTTPLSRRHSDPPSSDPWTDDRSGLLDLWADASDGEGFKEAVALSSPAVPAPLRLSTVSPIVITTQNPSPIHPTSDLSARPAPLHYSTQPSTRENHSLPLHPALRPRAHSEMTYSSLPPALRIETPSVAQSALSTILTPTITPTPTSSISPPSLTSESSSLSPLPSLIPSPSPPSSSRSPSPSHHHQPQTVPQQTPTFDTILNHRTILTPSGDSYIVTPPKYIDDQPPPVALELRTRLDEVLKNWGQGTSPLTPSPVVEAARGDAMVRMRMMEGGGAGGGGGFMAREERALSWHPGLAGRGGGEGEGGER